MKLSGSVALCKRTKRVCSERSPPGDGALSVKLSVLLSRPFLGLETKTTGSVGHQVSRSRPRPGQNELESRDHGLEITTLVLGQSRSTA